MFYAMSLLSAAILLSSSWAVASIDPPSLLNRQKLFAGADDVNNNIILLHLLIKYNNILQRNIMLPILNYFKKNKKKRNG